MKSVIVQYPVFLSLLFLMPNLVSADNPVKEFRVSKVGADKTELLNVFAAVQSKEAGVPEAFEVLQRLSDTNYLVYPMKAVSRVVSSSSSSYGGGGGSYTYNYSQPDRSTLYWLVTESPWNAVGGETISGIFAIKTGNVRTYTTALGAQKSVKELVEIQPPLLSRDEFVSRLRAGEEWTLESYRLEPCSRCFGDGKLSDLQGNARCPDCRGKGKVQVDLIVKW